MGLVQKSTHKIIEKEAKSVPLTHIYMSALFPDTARKSGKRGEEKKVNYLLQLLQIEDIYFIMIFIHVENIAFTHIPEVIFQ